MARRNLIATVVSVAGVLLAGVALIAVSFGILDASSASEVGNLSAAGPSTPVSSTASVPVTSLSGPEGGQLFEVGSAGTVEVGVRDGRLVLLDIEDAEGWEDTSSQPAADRVIVHFDRDGVRLTFTARLEGGEVRAEVTQSGASGSPAGSTPAPGSAPAPAPAPSAGAPTVPAPGGPGTTAARPDDDGWDDDGGGSEVDDDHDDDHDDDQDAEDEDHEDEDDDGRDD